MFERWKYKRKRKQEVAELTAYIDGQYASELNGAKTEQEKGDADQIAYSITEWQRNRLDWLLQEDILEALKTAPFDVPEDYWYDAGWGYKKVLTRKGDAWARHELDKMWRANVEFWFKLVLPIFALALSIIALVKKSN
jgi:lipopolysaccharide export LptBFGC system permease protein LptF